MRELLGGFPDEPVQEAAVPDLRQVDAHPQALAAWDASDDARPDATDAADLHRALSVADVEKLAAPALGVRARDAPSLRARQPVPLELLALAVELCIPGAVQFVEQSCAEPEAAPMPHLREVQPDAARPAEAAVRQKL